MSHSEIPKISPPVERYEDFICACEPEREDKAEQLVAEVQSALQCKDDDFLTEVVADLQWGHGGAYIRSIMMDQWFGICAEGPLLTTFIQCDVVEHGLAATWKAFEDRRKALEKEGWVFDGRGEIIAYPLTARIAHEVAVSE